MRKELGRAGALAVLALLVGGPLGAQLAGNPVYAKTGGGIGLTLAGDFGKGLNNASGKTSLFGARAELGLPFIAVGVGAGFYDPNVSGRDREIAFAGNLGFQFIGGALLPVSVGVHAGAGYTKLPSAGPLPEVTSVTVPLSVVVGLNVPTPGLNIDPWIAPRIQISRTEIRSGTGSPTRDTDSDVGVAGGVDISLPMGLGLHVAADYVKRSAAGGVDASPLVFGIGVHYRIAIPSLGVPIVPIM